MRALVAALTAVVALLVAPLAAATLYPPVGPGGLHIVKFAQTKTKQRVRSCAAHTKSTTAVSRVARRVHPVACEQPPRANLFNAGFMYIFRP